MIKAYLSSLSKSRSLKAEIRNAEQQIVIRQRGISVRSTTLVRKIHQQITAPATLLLAGGIGFIIGELTRRRSSSNHGVSGKQRTKGSSPLRSALNLLTSIHTLYMALPTAWKVRFFHASTTPGRQAPERQAQQVTSAFCAAKDCGSSKR
jgi:hypothetical protein